MAKQRGRELVLQYGTTSGATTTYADIATLNSKSMTINANTIDATTAASTAANAVWMENLDGVKSMSVTADGRFGDTTQEAKLREEVMSTSAGKFKLVVPDFGSFTADFFVTSFEMSGELEGAVTFSISLESSGSVAFA